MKRISAQVMSTAMAMTAFAGPALAHTGVGHTAGFVHGFGHPITGLDHVLAMVAVGLLAARLGGKALWLVPLSFMGMMAVGGLLGFAGASVPLVELGIGVSVLILGGLVAADVRMPTALAMGLVAFFAIFHGYAHGAEVPADAGGSAYIAGFITATGLLHLAGIAIGLAAGRLLSSNLASRVAGAAIAVTGVALLAGAV